MPHGQQQQQQQRDRWMDVGNGCSARSKLDKRYFRYFINGNGYMRTGRWPALELEAVGAALGAGAAWIYDALRQLPI